MFTCEIADCVIEELTNSNEFLLYELLRKNESEYRQKVFDEKMPETLEEFDARLKKYFETGRIFQFLVIQSNCAVGTVYFYSFRQNSSVKISCFFEKNIQGCLLISKVLACCAVFARSIIKISEIRFSVFRDNSRMISIANRIRAVTKEESSSELKIDFSMEGKTIDYWIKKILG